MRAGRNASRGTFLRQKRGTGNESILRSLVGFGVSPHGQLCLHSHLATPNHINFNSGIQILGGGGGGGEGGIEHFGGEASPALPPLDDLRL